VDELQQRISHVRPSFTTIRARRRVRATTTADAVPTDTKEQYDHESESYHRAFSSFPSAPHAARRNARHGVGATPKLRAEIIGSPMNIGSPLAVRDEREG
jgi:hypothetical protein